MIKIIKQEIKKILCYSAVLPFCIAVIAVSILAAFYLPVYNISYKTAATDEYVYASESWVAILQKDKVIYETELMQNYSISYKRKIESKLASVNRNISILRYLIDKKIKLYKTVDYNANSAYNDYYLKGLALDKEIFLRSFNYYSYIDPVTGQTVEVFTNDYSYFSLRIFGDDTSPKALTDVPLFAFFLLALILSVSSFSKEFYSGTFKLLLIRPINRKKLAFTKLLSVTAIICICLSAALLFNLAIALFFGESSGFLPQLTASEGNAFLINPALSILLNFLDILSVSLGAAVLTAFFAVTVKLTVFAAALPVLSAFGFKISAMLLPNIAFFDFFNNLRIAENFVNGVSANIHINPFAAVAAAVIFLAFFVWKTAETYDKMNLDGIIGKDKG